MDAQKRMARFCMIPQTRKPFFADIEPLMRRTEWDI
jgi:hypothetical protein